ncbi:unnamed protein product [Caenorhabditis auriculariae]|uniref:Chromo domain-containing protein n=1 Tax=Caenorhabditis auriculariae TaxID=2777116 RepID=A0A8S1HDL9_9PELO|nr:unnamed protein product [Caenorhabditis auriculariae]
MNHEKLQKSASTVYDELLPHARKSSGSLFTNMKPNNTHEEDEDGVEEQVELDRPVSPAPAAESADTTEPPAGDGLSEEVFVVGKILDHKFKRGDLMLKVSWEGYSAEHDTWEPEENIATCAKEAIDDYMFTLDDSERNKIASEKQKYLEKERRRSEKAERKKHEKKEKRSSARLSATPTPKSEKRRGRPPKEDGKAADESGDYESFLKSSSKRKRRDSGSSVSSKDSEFEPKKKKSKRDKGSAKSAAPTTKAALKAYDAPASSGSPTKKLRNTWLLDSDSEASDTEKPAGPELTLKLKREDVEDPSHNSAPSSSKRDKEKEKEKKKERKSKENHSSSSHHEKKHEEKAAKDWSVVGMAQQPDSSLIILMNNSKTEERRQLSPEEAFKLNSWGFCKYLIDRVVF